jgi:hypothetical protein
MKFYEGDPPRHGHRSPAELADDEILASLRGDFCAMPEAESDDEALAERNRAVPLVLDSGDRSSDAKRGSGSKPSYHALLKRAAENGNPREFSFDSAEDTEL